MIQDELWMSEDDRRHADDFATAVAEEVREESGDEDEVRARRFWLAIRSRIDKSFNDSGGATEWYCIFEGQNGDQYTTVLVTEAVDGSEATEASNEAFDAFGRMVRAVGVRFVSTTRTIHEVEVPR